jgi:predicted P-loop ATPase
MSAGRKLPETKPSQKAANRVQQVKDFLASFYEIKINIFDPGKSFIECKDKKRYERQPTFEDLSLHMEEEGVRGCDGILKKIIASPNQIKVFNPIVDYVKSLDGAWKGESQIEKFCNYISVREFPGNDKDFYHERFKRLFKKWGAAAIAQVLGDHCNDVVLCFVHADEGIGKSSLIQFLLPKQLSAYYQKSDKDPRYFDIPKAFTSNLIINFDDNVGLTKNNAEPIKAALSNNEFKLNKYFEDSMPRMASCALTSNKTPEMGGFLLPELGTRRWAIIDLDKIDHEYSKKIDVHQLWAEFYLLYKTADFNYIWDMDDFDEFQEFNQKYMVETNAKRLIREYYRVPTHDTEQGVQYKQPIEILQDLRNARKLTSSMSNVSEITIGFALKASGFEKTSIRKDGDGPRYVYKVIQLY